MMQYVQTYRMPDESVTRDEQVLPCMESIS